MHWNAWTGFLSGDFFGAICAAWFTRRGLKRGWFRL